MNLSEKLKTIQQILNLTQTQLASRLGVSFVTLNRWLGNQAKPRPGALAAIDELYLEVTAQKVIPVERLAVKKQALSIRAGGRNILEEILANPDIHDEFILKLTYHSNAIEGSTLSEPDTAAVLFDDVALPDKSLKEQLEAKNHQAALEYLFGHLQAGQAIDEALLLRLHGILLNGVYPDAGRYRNHGVRILGVNLPTANYLSVPRLVKEMSRTWKSHSVDVVSLAARSHAELEKIHPFSDGNGRVGRLIMSGLLLRQNLAPAIIRQDQKRLYYAYLHKAQTRGDSSQLEDYLCDRIDEGFDVLDRLSI